MSEQCNATSQQCSEVNSLNAKLAYDSAAQLQHQSLVNNQANASAWQSLNLAIATDAQILKHFANLGLLQAGQTGFTQNQAAVTPIRTGVADTLAAASYTPNRVTDVAAAGTSVAAEGVATANQAIADALATAVSLMTQSIAALQAVLVTAAGGASTPSQTQAKPTT